MCDHTRRKRSYNAQAGVIYGTKWLQKQFFCDHVCLFKPGSITLRCTTRNYNVNQISVYLDVLVVGQAGRNAGQSVVVEVQLSQVGDISQCFVFHRADLIVAQTKPAGKISR